MPIQSRRTGDTDAFQQFSTPPHYAYAAAWAANLKPKDVVLEPSAGNGGLAVFAKKAGAKVVTNELGEVRRANLKGQGFDMVTGHDAEQIHNLLPKGITPSVVLMNPPFSNAAQRGGIKDSNITGRHIDQALETLAPGGRLVAITGHNFMESNGRNAAVLPQVGQGLPDPRLGRRVGQGVQPVWHFIPHARYHHRQGGTGRSPQRDGRGRDGRSPDRHAERGPR
jgi:predicted RNA methylase